MADVIVHGAAYSTYTRSALLALIEKGIPYTVNFVDILQPVPDEHRIRHPWGKIPVLEHDGFEVFETTAVLRYIDEAFPGPSLQPATARDRARMDQAIGLLNSFGYKPIVSELFLQRAAMPKFGQEPNEAMIAASLPEVEKTLDALVKIQGGDAYLAGTFSLADLMLAPIYVYLLMTPEGAKIAAARPSLMAWWEKVSARPSMIATPSPLEG